MIHPLCIKLINGTQINTRDLLKMTTDMYAETKRLLVKIRLALAYQTEHENNSTATLMQKSARQTTDRKCIIRRF